MSAQDGVKQSKKIRVLIATGIYPPEDGGPATYSKLLVDELPKIGAATGNSVAGDLPSGGFEVQVVPFRIVRYLPKIIRHIAYFFALIHYARVSKSDIVYAQDPVSVGLPALLATAFLNIGKTKSEKNSTQDGGAENDTGHDSVVRDGDTQTGGRKKFLLKIVGDYAWEQGVQRCGVRDRLDEFAGSIYAASTGDNAHGSHGRRYPALVLLLKNIQRHVADHADHIIVPSQYLKKIIVKWGVSSDKISVIYNSFEVPKDLLAKEEARTKITAPKSVSQKVIARNNAYFSIAPSDRLIVSVARLVPWKGLTLLISLMKDFKEFPNLKLIIIGSGPDRESLERFVKEYDLGAKVAMIAPLPHDRMLEYLSAADLFVLNTAYEGLSHVLLEAMAVGTPIITTAVGGNIELIRNGDQGLLVGYNDQIGLRDAIRKLLSDPLCARDLAARARKKVESFGRDRMLAEVATLMRSL
jgi:glycosyltransferase involved in cell wall biosynthesis